jgi:multicomponent K+:H+ antiporter subunit D
MSSGLQHLPAVPILAPLLAAALLLLVPQSKHLPRALIALTSTLVQVAAAIGLLWITWGASPQSIPSGLIYAIGNWPPPYGIVLVADRLATLMLALNAAIALPVLISSFAHWDRLGVHYHTLYQLLLMGLNGAFLTGDLFNLFVFFEVLLAASYGLLLHGGGTTRVTSSLHYIAVNLAASLIFLVGVAILYGASGTLNLAQLAARWPLLGAADRKLFQGGAAILAIAFLTKAGIWPLNFWLPRAYSAATAPVAAIFSILTKVGVYAILRMGSLLNDPAPPILYGGSWLFIIGIATIVFGSIGALSARQPARLIAFTVIVSVGTVLAAFALDSASATAPILFYLLSSVPATAALFLLTGMTARFRTIPLPALDPHWAEATYTAFGVGEPPKPRSPDDEIGTTIPAAVAFLGLSFLGCALLTAGLPPLAGFLAKFALLAAVLNSPTQLTHPLQVWILMSALLGASLAALLAFLRAGIRLFWSSRERPAVSIRMIEAGPVVLLLLFCVGLTVMAGPVMTYVTTAAQGLHDPKRYINSVLGPSKLPPP